MSVGNPKTGQKGGYSGWIGESSFASLWLERWLVRACKGAYDSALVRRILLINTFGLINEWLQLT
jgi:hypothetical protein